MSMKNSNDTTGNRSRGLPVCSVVPQPTAPPRAYLYWMYLFQFSATNSLSVLNILQFHVVLPNKFWEITLNSTTYTFTILNHSYARLGRGANVSAPVGCRINILYEKR